MATNDDYSDDVDTTGILIISQPISGNIESVGDEDWFKVYLSPDITYEFKLLGNASGGGTLGTGSGTPYLEFYNIDGRYEESSSGGGTGDDPLMSYEVDEEGYYYLSVSDLYEDSTGTYTVWVTESNIDDDYLDNANTTSTLTLGQPITGDIELPHDEDWFRVYLEEGTTYLFSLTGLDGGGGTLGDNYNDAYLRVYDPSGYYEDSAANGGEGGDPLISYEPEEDGFYYLAALELGDKGTGTYTLLVTESTIDDDYLDNKLSTAQLAIGLPISGDIELPNDEDWFKTFLFEDKSYTITLQGYDAGVGTLGGNYAEAYLRIFDASGHIEESETDGGLGDDPLINFVPDVTGYYYVSALDLWDSGTGTYVVKVESDDNVIQGSTNDESFSFQHNMHFYGDEGIDTLQINAAENQVILNIQDSASLITTSEGIAEIISIERIEFSDKTVAIDIDGHGGLAAKVIAGVYGANEVATNSTLMGKAIDKLDNKGYVYATLVEWAMSSQGLNGTTVENYQNIVNVLWKNVFGVLPTTDENALFTYFLATGELNYVSIGYLASEGVANTGQLDLVGLADTGIEYIPYEG